MDKVTIFIIILFWALSAIFKSIQKKESQKRNEPFDFPPAPDHKPQDKESPFFEDKADQNEMIQIDDLFEILENQMKSPQKPPPPPIFEKKPVQQSPVSLEELFVRSSTRAQNRQPSYHQPSSRQPQPHLPKTRTKVDEAEEIVFETAEKTEKKTSDERISEWDRSLSYWQNAMVLHEILQPPKCLRRK